MPTAVTIQSLLAKKMPGRLMTDLDSKKSTFVWDPDSDRFVFLRFALILRGTETPVFPAFVMDDWGNERKKLSVYRWLYEEGDRYPRAEIFGYERRDGAWIETQLFTRELELGLRWPVYLFPTRDTVPAESTRLSAIATPVPDATQPTRIKRPEDLPFSLQRARVQWWHIPPQQSDNSFLNDSTR